MSVIGNFGRDVQVTFLAAPCVTLCYFTCCPCGPALACYLYPRVGAIAIGRIATASFSQSRRGKLEVECPQTPSLSDSLVEQSSILRIERGCPGMRLHCFPMRKTKNAISQHVPPAYSMKLLKLCELPPTELRLRRTRVFETLRSDTGNLLLI
mmetsp:Transcript_31766/g.56353  ORF Transcript_31766/g.56353 Transcript_31766/m.56353 type:complete len:153 (-) Transcript_31766:5-463(-)